MKKVFIYLIIIVLALIACIVILMPSKDNKKKNDSKKYDETEEKNDIVYTPALYKICDDDSCIYLLGSIHIGDEKINNLNSIIIDAYKETDKIAVEVDITDETISLDDINGSEGERLDDLDDAELKNDVANFFKTNLMLDYANIKNFKIGYISTLIESVAYMKSGLSQTGIDTYFINLAKEDEKDVISIETMEEQMELLFGNSKEFYKKQIKESLDKYEESIELLKELYEAYLNGDIETLKELLKMDTENATEEELDYLNRMYTLRNIKMAKKCEEFLLNNENVFVTVGAAHVITDDGIIDLLKDKYEIALIK